MIKNLDAVRAIEKHRGEAVVISTMVAGRTKVGWPAVSRKEELDLPLGGAMGKASSMGLGLALAHPDRKVFILDGDGSLLMNLGSLTTISEQAPQNLYHFVFENGVYAVTGGQPIPGEGKLSFQGLAQGAGYAAAYDFDNLEELATSLPGILRQKGPVLVNLRIEPEIENTPIHLRERSRRTMVHAIQDLQKVLKS